jgi:hypothetical protein
MRFTVLRLRARGVGNVVALVVAVCVAGLVVLGADQDYSASRVQLHAGTAWLASYQTGQVTLVDGASAEVAAQVQVAAPASPLRVAQQGGAAYVLNPSRTPGTRSRSRPHRTACTRSTPAAECSPRLTPKP